MTLAVRAGAVGLDPWRVLRLGASTDEHLATEAIVERLEVNEIARADGQAQAIAYRVREALLDVFEALGYITRK